MLFVSPQSVHWSLNGNTKSRQTLKPHLLPSLRGLSVDFQGSTRFAISGKGTHILRTEQGNVNFQYDRSKQAYVMHPNVHHKLEKYGDTFAEQ